MRIYGFLAAILGVQRRQYNVIDFYPTLSKFAVLLRKCCPYHKATVCDYDQKCKRNVIQIDLSTCKPTLLKISTYSLLLKTKTMKNLACKGDLVNVRA